MVESVLWYGSKMWAMKNEEKGRVKAAEMEDLGRSARILRSQHIRNEEIPNRMSTEETVIQRIEKMDLKWFWILTPNGRRKLAQTGIYMYTSREEQESPASPIVERRYKRGD